MAKKKGVPRRKAKKKESVQTPNPHSARILSRPICHDESFVIGGTQMPTTVIGPGPTLPPDWRG